MTCPKLENHVAVCDVYESENYKNLFPLRLVHDVLPIVILL